MNWNKIYTEKLKELNTHRLLPNASIDQVVHEREKRFKANTPTKPEHFSELEFLIYNYDNSGDLFKKYQSALSIDFISELLLKKRPINEDQSTNIENVINILIPHYLSTMADHNPNVNYEFVEQQIVNIIKDLDHDLSRKRANARKVLEIIIPKFDLTNQKLKSTIIDLIIDKMNAKNIRNVNTLFLKNLNSIDPPSLNSFINKQISQKLMGSKVAILYLKKAKNLNQKNYSKLFDFVKLLENSEQIVRTINPAHNIKQVTLNEYHSDVSCCCCCTTPVDLIEPQN